MTFFLTHIKIQPIKLSIGIDTTNKITVINDAANDEIDIDNNKVDLENIDDSKAIIEYIDIMEADNIMVAMNQDNLLVNSKKNFSYLNYNYIKKFQTYFGRVP